MGGNSFDIDDKLTMDERQILTANLVAKDSLGFVHEYQVIHFVVGSKAQREPYFGWKK